MRTYIDKDGRTISVRRYFPLGWKLYADGELIGNIAWKNRLETILCELGCREVK